MLEKPRSLHASDDSSAPNADSWRGKKDKHDSVVAMFFLACNKIVFSAKVGRYENNFVGCLVINWFLTGKTLSYKLRVPKGINKVFCLSVCLSTDMSNIFMHFTKRIMGEACM